jgi:hypothetical protein
MLRHKKRVYLKSLGLPSQKPIYQQKAERAVKVTKKALLTAGWKFLKLFEDSSTPHH